MALYGLYVRENGESDGRPLTSPIHPALIEKVPRYQRTQQEPFYVIDPYYRPHGHITSRPRMNWPKYALPTTTIIIEARGPISSSELFTTKSPTKLLCHFQISCSYSGVCWVLKDKNWRICNFMSVNIAFTSQSIQWSIIGRIRRIFLPLKWMSGNVCKHFW